MLAVACEAMSRHANFPGASPASRPNRTNGTNGTNGTNTPVFPPLIGLKSGARPRTMSHRTLPLP